MARQRNNITKLPSEIRLKIAEMLDDGATYDEIRADEAVSSACAARKLEIHNTTLLAYRESAEFDEYKKSRRKFAENIERRRMTALFVDSESGTDNLERVARFELMRRILEKLEADTGDDPEAGELTVKELRTLQSALLSAENKKITAYEAQIANLQAQLDAALAAKGTSAGLSDEALKAIEEKAGLL